MSIDVAANFPTWHSSSSVSRGVDFENAKCEILTPRQFSQNQRGVPRAMSSRERGKSVAVLAKSVPQNDEELKMQKL